MKKIAKFHKVSFDEFEKAWKGEFPEAKEEEIKAVYEELKLPKRATRGSAGYDFYTPFNIILKPGETVKIPTGIRAEMEEGWVLKLYPRSGLGFKFRCSSITPWASLTATIFIPITRAISSRS